MLHCEDCAYYVSWGRPPEIAAKYGQAYECRIGVLLCPNPNDFCSRAEAIQKCNKCGKIFDVFPNFCPNCGNRLIREEKSDGCLVLNDCNLGG